MKNMDEQYLWNTENLINLGNTGLSLEAGQIDPLLAWAGPATFKKKFFFLFWTPTKTSTNIKSISFW
jgi:hypothetical protein